jgi:two-component system chemotaxis response regulator CheY
MRILLAEDAEVTAASLGGILASLGHRVTFAADGLSAWRILREERIPVVLCDWMMPGLDGPSLCRRIRGLAESSYTYIILLTVRDRRADRMEGLRAGADDFLVKLFDAEELAVRLEIARRILSVQEGLERQNARLEELATTDDLTGLANRREFRRALERQFALAGRQGVPLSLILLDIDRFKDFNDTFDHPAGDAALRVFAQTLRANCREHEPIARYEGEEFAIMLFDTAREPARGAAERVRAALGGSRWAHRPLTASFGIATTGQGLSGAADLVERADAALYASKRRGRDRVTHADDVPDNPRVGPAGGQAIGEWPPAPANGFPGAGLSSAP